MVQPINSSFTLRPARVDGNNNNRHRELTFTSSSDAVFNKPRRRRLYKNQNKRSLFSKHRSFSPFESIERRVLPLPADFEPPLSEDYWKKRCFHWQGICQGARKRMRDMDEDQRQLRRRIRELEELLAINTSRDLAVLEEQQAEAQGARKVVVSPSSSVDRPPTLIVTVLKMRKCCFYLTDSEGLTDSEDFSDDLVDDEEMEKFEEDRGDCSEERSE